MIAKLLAGLINFFTIVVEFFLGLRVIFRLFGANPEASFVQWVYDSSSVVMQPFRGIFPVEMISPGHYIDFSALFAMIIYGLVGMAFLSLVTFLTPAETAPVKKK